MSQCELYASGNAVVTARPYPPMPPHPWFTRDPSIETPYSEQDVPLVREDMRRFLGYARAPKTKALALGVAGIARFFGGESSEDEAIRRTLELCGDASRAMCLIVAVDDAFVVPIPRSRTVIGLFRVGPVNAIAPEFRDEVARALGNATRGWSAVAAGASGRVGVKTGAESEPAAVDGSLQACNRQDRDCRVVVIGPFVVEGGT